MIDVNHGLQRKEAGSGEPTFFGGQLSLEGQAHAALEEAGGDRIEAAQSMGLNEEQFRRLLEGKVGRKG